MLILAIPISMLALSHSKPDASMFAENDAVIGDFSVLYDEALSGDVIIDRILSEDPTIVILSADQGREIGTRITPYIDENRYVVYVGVDEVELSAITGIACQFADESAHDEKRLGTGITFDPCVGSNGDYTFSGIVEVYTDGDNASCNTYDTTAEDMRSHACETWQFILDCRSDVAP